MANISETKTPKAGEWWLRNSGGRIFFICGFDPEGWVVHWNEDVGFFSSQMRFFCKEFRHEPRCTGFGWVEPAIDPGEGYELLPVGTMLQWYDQVLASDMTKPSWMDTMCMNERIGSRHGLKGTYRRKIKPVESPDDWVTQDRFAVRCGSDEIRWSDWEPDQWVVPLGFWPLEEIHGFVDPDNGSTLSIRCRRRDLPVESPAEDPNDMPLNPVPGKVVATGTVTFTPVTPTTCVACGVNWALDGSVSCRECYEHAIEATGCPVETPDNMAAIIAEHTQQVRELTQRIGELCFQVNERDRVIEQIRTALHQGYSV